MKGKGKKEESGKERKGKKEESGKERKGKKEESGKEEGKVEGGEERVVIF